MSEARAGVVSSHPEEAKSSRSVSRTSGSNDWKAGLQRWSDELLQQRKILSHLHVNKKVLVRVTANNEQLPPSLRHILFQNDSNNNSSNTLANVESQSAVFLLAKILSIRSNTTCNNSNNSSSSTSSSGSGCDSETIYIRLLRQGSAYSGSSDHNHSTSDTLYVKPTDIFDYYSIATESIVSTFRSGKENTIATATTSQQHHQQASSSSSSSSSNPPSTKTVLNASTTLSNDQSSSTSSSPPASFDTALYVHAPFEIGDTVLLQVTPPPSTTTTTTAVSKSKSAPKSESVSQAEKHLSDSIFHTYSVYEPYVLERIEYAAAAATVQASQCPPAAQKNSNVNSNVKVDAEGRGAGISNINDNASSSNNSIGSSNNNSANSRRLLPAYLNGIHCLYFTASTFDIKAASISVQPNLPTTPRVPSNCLNYSNIGPVTIAVEVKQKALSNDIVFLPSIFSFSVCGEGEEGNIQRKTENKTENENFIQFFNCGANFQATDSVDTKYVLHIMDNLLRHIRKVSLQLLNDLTSPTACSDCSSLRWSRILKRQHCQRGIIHILRMIENVLCICFAISTSAALTAGGNDVEEGLADGDISAVRHFDANSPLKVRPDHHANSNSNNNNNNSEGESDSNNNNSNSNNNSSEGESDNNSNSNNNNSNSNNNSSDNNGNNNSNSSEGESDNNGQTESASKSIGLGACHIVIHCLQRLFGTPTGQPTSGRGATAATAAAGGQEETLLSSIVGTLVAAHMAVPYDVSIQSWSADMSCLFSLKKVLHRLHSFYLRYIDRHHDLHSKTQQQQREKEGGSTSAAISITGSSSEEIMQTTAVNVVAAAVKSFDAWLQSTCDRSIHGICNFHFRATFDTIVLRQEWTAHSAFMRDKKITHGVFALFASVRSIIDSIVHQHQQQQQQLLPICSCCCCDCTIDDVTSFALRLLLSATTFIVSIYVKHVATSNTVDKTLTNTATVVGTATGTGTGTKLANTTEEGIEQKKDNISEEQEKGQLGEGGEGGGMNTKEKNSKVPECGVGFNSSVSRTRLVQYKTDLRYVIYAAMDTLLRIIQWRRTVRRRSRKILMLPVIQEGHNAKNTMNDTLNTRRYDTADSADAQIGTGMGTGAACVAAVVDLNAVLKAAMAVLHILDLPVGASSSSSSAASAAAAAAAGTTLGCSEENISVTLKEIEQILLTTTTTTSTGSSSSKQKKSEARQQEQQEQKAKSDEGQKVRMVSDFDHILDSLVFDSLSPHLSALPIELSRSTSPPTIPSSSSSSSPPSSCGEMNHEGNAGIPVAIPGADAFSLLDMPHLHCHSPYIYSSTSTSSSSSSSPPLFHLRSDAEIKVYETAQNDKKATHSNPFAGQQAVVFERIKALRVVEGNALLRQLLLLLTVPVKNSTTDSSSSSSGKYDPSLISLVSAGSSIDSVCGVLLDNQDNIAFDSTGTSSSSSNSGSGNSNVLLLVRTALSMRHEMLRCVYPKLTEEQNDAAEFTLKFIEQVLDI